jgi:hypothetical protein
VIVRLLLRLLSVAILFVVGRLVARAFGGARRSSRPRPVDLPAEDSMVRDRICNTFIPRGRALVEGHGEGRRYFCSERCRRQFLARPAARGVASG